MTKTELKTIFQNYLVVLECHNEQKRHVRLYLQSRNIRVLEYPFFTADYSFMIMPNQYSANKEPLFFGNDFLIERKSGVANYGGGYQELANNLRSGHQQFKAEFQRMTEVKHVYLLLENTTSKNDIVKLRYDADNIAVLEKIYQKFLYNRNQERLKAGSNPIEIVHTPLDDSGETIIKLIYKYLINYFQI